MLAETFEVERLVVDEELGSLHLYRPDANGKSVHVKRVVFLGDHRHLQYKRTGVARTISLRFVLGGSWQPISQDNAQGRTVTSQARL